MKTNQSNSKAVLTIGDVMRSKIRPNLGVGSYEVQFKELNIVENENGGGVEFVAEFNGYGEWKFFIYPNSFLNYWLPNLAHALNMDRSVELDASHIVEQTPGLKATLWVTRDQEYDNRYSYHWHDPEKRNEKQDKEVSH